jgi:hypothetical protein
MLPRAPLLSVTKHNNNCSPLSVCVCVCVCACARAWMRMSVLWRFLHKVSTKVLILDRQIMDQYLWKFVWIGQLFLHLIKRSHVQVQGLPDFHLSFTRKHKILWKFHQLSYDSGPYNHWENKKMNFILYWLHENMWKSHLKICFNIHKNNLSFSYQQQVAMWHALSVFCTRW